MRTPGGASDPEPEPARLLSRDRYEAVLAEVVALINADPLDAATRDASAVADGFASRAAAAERGASFAGTVQADTFGGATATFDRYACDGSVKP